MLGSQHTSLTKFKNHSLNESESTKEQLSTPSNGTILNNYNHYFSTGTYKLRYPNVNQRTFSFINNYIDRTQKKIHMLDYGCGNGRYLIALLLRHLNIEFTAYDIASIPLNSLREKLMRIKQTSRVHIYGDINKLQEESYDSNKKNTPYNVALLLFGVLSHISSHKERQALLCYLKNNISPTTGFLLLSVPNKARRFLSLQKQQNSHEITYSRNINQQDTEFYYHLYSVQSIKQELESAGLEVVKVTAESLLPESYITRIPFLGWIDHWLCKLTPAEWGYGILICCRKK